tara:strand:- start:513 stop:794 length:282 start_codon:yes stop_codon:yes gene_type:complete
MSRACQLTGKKFLNGNNVSHANNKTKRRFFPNLQKISFVSEKLKQTVQLRVAASTIRTVEKKGGLDDYLINTSNNKLPLIAKKLKKRILAASE